LVSDFSTFMLSVCISVPLWQIRIFGLFFHAKSGYPDFFYAGPYRPLWYGMVNVDLYSAVITKVSNALNTLVSGEKPVIQTLSKGFVALLCSEVDR